MSRVPAKVYYWKHDLFLVHSCALKKKDLFDETEWPGGFERAKFGLA